MQTALKFVHLLLILFLSFTLIDFLTFFLLDLEDDSELLALGVTACLFGGLAGSLITYFTVKRRAAQQ